MKRSIILLVALILWCGANAQPKFEIIQVNGMVKAIDPYWSFAYERITITANGTERTFLFHPKYGSLFLSNFKANDEITLRVKIDVSKKDVTRKLDPVIMAFLSRDYIVGVLVNGSWHELDDGLKRSGSPEKKVVYLDKKVIDEIVVDNYKRGFVVEGSIAAYQYFQGIKKINNQDVRTGDYISFVGAVSEFADGYMYPKEKIREVVRWSRLYKESGTIKSLLYKQNNVCIGMVVKGANRLFRVSFPSNYATRVKAIVDREQPVIAYFSDFTTNELLPPELHAIICGSDTLKIPEQGFYGGADIKHDHRDVLVEGKINKVNRLSNGTIYSLIVDDEYYIDIDFATQKQLAPSFKKGIMVAIEGRERIKADGELYSEKYSIVIPSKIQIGEKTFNLNQLP